MTVIPFRAPGYDGSASGPRVYPGPEPVHLRVVEPASAHVPEPLHDYEAGMRMDLGFVVAVTLLCGTAVFVLGCFAWGLYDFVQAASYWICAGLEWMGRA